MFIYPFEPLEVNDQLSHPLPPPKYSVPDDVLEAAKTTAMLATANVTTSRSDTVIFFILQKSFLALLFVRLPFLSSYYSPYIGNSTSFHHIWPLIAEVWIEHQKLFK